MFLKQKPLWSVVCLFLLMKTGVQAQENILSADTVQEIPTAVLPPDSILSPPSDVMLRDTATAIVDSATNKTALEAPVICQAQDSIIFTADNIAYVYGKGDVKYQQIQLQSELIEMHLDSSVVYATFAVDSIGEEYGYPLFVDGEQQIEAKTMRYNFRSRKAYAREVLTQQGEGFLIAGATKKMPDETMNMVDGKYTTCDDHEHPHFYINMTRAKARPGKNIVTGPAYLVIADVPLYLLGLPFAFFPFTSTYSSGIIMPTYGDEMTQGFYLRDGGYYFALSDYVDLAVTGELYTKGSWGLAARSTYRKRYKYSGNFNGSYQVTKWGEKGMDDYSLAKAFKINWTHTQDAKANPYRTFSANVNFSTNQYDRNNIKQQASLESTQNNKGSSVSISQRFPDNPLSISATMNINQRSQDSSLSVTLPDVTLTMSRIYPLKRKNAVGQERWYEKISVSYSGYLRNSLSAKENVFFQKNLIRDWKNAMQHSIPVSATYTAFGYLNISPSVQYQERWYTNKILQAYDTTFHRLTAVDTTYGFYRVYNYSTSISASTTLYGMFKPWPFIRKISGVDMIRHRLEPSVSFSATPDFGAPNYGYHVPYSYTDTQGQTVEGVYSPYQHQLFGVPGRGKQGSLSFGLENNVEAKVASKRDSSGLKKISLIDNLSLRMSYNLAADSFQWSDLSAGIRLKLSRSYTLNLSGAFDTYTYSYNESTGAVRRVNVPRWKAGKGIGRLRGTSTSFSYTFNNATFKNNALFKKLFGGGEDTAEDPSPVRPDEDPTAETPPPAEPPTTGTRLRKEKSKQTGEFDEDGYYNASVPWNFSFNYNLGIAYGAFNPRKLEYDYRFTQALSFNGSIQPTKYWRINFNASYDFDQKKISYMTCNVSRDLHCFQFTASIIPVGYRKSYSFSVAVNSSLLQDLKYQQSSSYRSGQTWY